MEAQVNEMLQVRPEERPSARGLLSIWSDHKRRLQFPDTHINKELCNVSYQIAEIEKRMMTQSRQILQHVGYDAPLGTLVEQHDGNIFGNLCTQQKLVIIQNFKIH